MRRSADTGGPRASAPSLRRTVFAFAAVAAAFAATGAAAQPAGCRSTASADQLRQVLQCPDGLTITAESDSAYRLIDRNRDGRPEAVELSGRGLLIEYAGRRRGGFQVLTPHAIASVRGTVWAVDVKAETTAVFVREGRVGVTRASGAAGVVLAPGDGVDVDLAGGPLVVKRWSSERGTNLLARFGR